MLVSFSLKKIEMQITAKRRLNFATLCFVLLASPLLRGTLWGCEYEHLLDPTISCLNY